MPLGTPASFRGTLQADPAVVPGTFQGALAGFVEPGFVEPGFVASFPPQTFTGTLSRARIDAWDGELTYSGVRVVLAGQEVPQADLVGPVSLRESIDTHLASATVRIAGASYSIHRTERTWTRVPCELWFRQRTAGGAPQEVLRLEGVVRTATEVDHEGEPALDVTLGDLSAVYDRYRLCHEVPPYSGLTRGQIAREVAADAGVPATDIPDGARYDAPLQLDGVTLFEFLREWGEPEGWHWRWVGDTLTAYVPTLKLSPQAPDHVWTPREIETLQSDPPEDVPSRVTVRGFAALFVDEIGIETELTRTEVEALYAPKVAVEKQLSDGNREPTGFSSTEALRLVLLVIESRQRRGTRELKTTVEEWGWYNRAAGKLRTVSGDGETGDGYNYVTTYIDDEGKFVVGSRERFQLVAYRISQPFYFGDDLTERRETVHSWHRRTSGVAQTPPVGGTSIIGNLVGDDDVSYIPLAPTGELMPGGSSIEGFGRSSLSITRFHYNATGAAYREIQEEWGYYSPRASVSAAGNHYRYDGVAQLGTDNFIRVRTRDRNQFLTTDGRLRGLIDVESGYAILRKLDGAHDFGGGQASNESSERFRILERKNVAYHVIGHNQVEEVTYDQDGRHSRIILGPLPTPRYLSSPWVRLVQQPLELVIDDPVIEQWFGVSQEAIENPYIQSESEALRVYRERRARALAKKLSIGRAETLARPGDTVLVRWPPIIAERYLLVEADLQRDPITGRADGAYRLEHPL
jgi:hypothetical protein